MNLAKYLGDNWRSNLIAIVAAVSTVPAVYSAMEAWMNHQPVDWHVLIGSALLAALGWVVKDAKTHSTVAQVEASQAKVEASTPIQQKAADVQAKDADKQAEGK